MSGHRFHLAQINIAKMRAPLEDPAMQDFVAQLDTINRLAEKSPGFIWRLQDDTGNATALRVFDDPAVLVNMSLWETLGALRAYVYRSAHRRLLRDRQRWFAPSARPHLALWWIPAGTLPTVADGRRRLVLIDANGPGPDAFTFSRVYDPPTDEPRPAGGTP